MKKIFTFWLLFLLPLACLFSQPGDTILYKQVDTTSLVMVVDYPPDFDATKDYPAMVFFFGGVGRGEIESI